MRKNKSRIRNIIFIIIGLVVVGSVYAMVKNNSKQTPQDITYTVHSETVENIIEIAGTISAAQEQKLQAAGDGTVTGVYVAAGDTVKKGDILIRIDDTTQQYELEQQDYQIEQKRISGAQRDVEMLLKQRKVLEQKLEDRIIKANFDGIVAYLNVAEGDYLVAKDEVGTMIDRTYLKALVEVAETDSSKIKPGQKVMFSFPAYEDHKIEGYLVSSYAIATVTSRGASVVKAEVRIDNPPEQILPNYSFIGEIEISPPETILLVERQAIGYGEDGSPFAEKILPDGTTERVPVTVTAYGNAFVKIISGLQDKDVLKQQSTGTVPIGAAEAPPPPPDK
ncbi:MAG: efflux RND transporter periplasmic adaptor subunit [Candidatus Treponema excrementipullorum]|nr:efflux RND transporter periplasmic adaptor subunit [Candidatus Treponema excrementipullorum]MDY4465097.1 efflux RND transporter periplasmic adaptor subunit [Candidatus Treponema excrementipullorum]